MKRSLRLAKMNFQVGILVAIALVIVLVVLLFPNRGLNPLASRFVLYGRFDDVAGLKRDAPVYFSGVEVGEVDSVDFLPPGSDHRLQV